jgi:hypothetical protein
VTRPASAADGRVTPGAGGRRRRLTAERAGGRQRMQPGDPGPGAQWWQAPGLPADSAVRNDDPQPQADTAFGLFTVKPAPIRVST